MAEPVRVGFERTIATLPLSALLPLKAVPDAIKGSALVCTVVVAPGEVPGPELAAALAETIVAGLGGSWRIGSP